MFSNVNDMTGGVHIEKIHNGDRIYDMRQSEDTIIVRDPTAGELFQGFRYILI